MIRCVVFDFGEVLSSPEDLYGEAARRLGVDAEAYRAGYWTTRSQWDLGGADAAYWGPLLRGLGKADTPEAVRAASEWDSHLWIRGVRPSALQVVADVRAAGRLTAVLSNASFSLDMALAASDLADAADYWFVSASMGVAKPSAAAYHRVEEVTECRGAEIAFVDDRPENVYAARRLGWHAHLFVDDAATRRWLEDLDVLGGAHPAAGRQTKDRARERDPRARS